MPPIVDCSWFFASNCAFDIRCICWSIQQPDGIEVLKKRAVPLSILAVVFHQPEGQQMALLRLPVDQINNNKQKLFRFQAGQSVMMLGFATIPKWDNKRGGFNEQSLKNYWPYLHGLCSCWLRCTRSRHRRHVNLGDDDLVPDEQASGQIKLFFKQRLIRCLFWLPILRFRLVAWNLFARGAAGFSPQPNGHPPLIAGIRFLFHGCFVPSAIIA